MANTRFAHVRSFELPDALLPSTYLVCRLDGRSFHRFSEVHGFEKPNDERGLTLMDRAARGVMEEISDVVMALGESDEYSFLLRKDCNLYNRRHSKILSALLSIFTSHYIFHWSTYFPSQPLQYPPSFDGRIVIYPSATEIRDYFAWRQADTHINNMYNTVFWALVQKGGLSTTAAHAELKGTVSSQKHEILHQRFGINYNNVPERYRKGSILVRKKPVSSTVTGLSEESSLLPNGDPLETEMLTEKANATSRKGRIRKQPEWDGTSGDIEVLHSDVIKDEFWDERPWLLK